MHRFSYRSLHLTVLLFWLISLSLSAARSQETEPTEKKPVPKKSPVKPSANLKLGTITEISEETLTLKDRAGATEAYTLTEKTRFLKNRREVKREDFKTGETVSLKLRKVRGKDAYTVFELMDTGSFQWLDGVRHKTTGGTIKELTDSTLTLKAEANEIVYTISEKTLWYKQGKVVQMDAYKAGQDVAVVPRSLPGGGIFARIVSDSKDTAEKAKKRPASTVVGKLKEVNTSLSKLLVLLSEGTERVVFYNAGTEILFKSKRVPLPILKPGVAVTIRLKTDKFAQEFASRITIDGTAKKPARTGKPKQGSGEDAPDDVGGKP